MNRKKIILFTKLASCALLLLLVFTYCFGPTKTTPITSDAMLEPTANFSPEIPDLPKSAPAPIPQSSSINYESNSSTRFYMSSQKVTQPALAPLREYNTESYNYAEENSFKNPVETPLSTFSIDVDTASYSNMRRFIMDGLHPATGSVRIEEMVNYFTYDYPDPTGEIPFSITTELASCPWNPEHHLAMIGLQGKKLESKDFPASNLVFLIDVSGSMASDDKLPLLKSALKLLIHQLREKDRVSVVVYAGAAGVVLEPTSGKNKLKILNAVEMLEAGGSTAGGQGIELAYKIAKNNFIKNGNNRVILATDGDFNVGISSEAELVSLIEQKQKSGIFLSVLGFGTGNYQDSKMELLADKGNGNYAYIDNLMEARKVLVQEIGSTLFTIAKDVKIQIEFNPALVKEYRLVGYENRLLNREDFEDDTKDAGELGAGHTVTAFYEIIPINANDQPKENNLKYQLTTIKDSSEWATIQLRYKEPKEETSKLLSTIIAGTDAVATPSENFLFASAVAEFGLLLNDSKYKGTASFESLIERAQKSKGKDEEGYRAEFIQLVKMMKTLNVSK